eukprot:10984003-Prorocentrum_lima.AAC.1
MQSLSSGERNATTQTYTRRIGRPENGEAADGSMAIRKGNTQEGAANKAGHNVYQTAPVQHAHLDDAQ